MRDWSAMLEESEAKDTRARLTNPSEVRSAFIARMMDLQVERSEEVGGHGWRDFANQYGPAALFSEIASIVHRLEQMFWVNTDTSKVKKDKALDLLIDLGNYASFLHDWVEENLE